jgi:hypothetical protein
MRIARHIALVFGVVPLLAGCATSTPVTNVPQLAAARGSTAGAMQSLIAKAGPALEKMQLHAAPATGAKSWPANGSYVYVSLFEYPSVDQINVYHEGNIKGEPVATITDGLDYASGLAVDQSRNLWVANAIGYVLEYPAGKSKPSKKLDVPASDGNPLNLYVGPDGTIYAITNGVGIIKHAAKGGDWSIVGAPADMNSLSSVVADTAGDLFVTGYVSGVSGGTVELQEAGSAQWGSIGFPSIAEPGGIAFDLLGRLIVANAFVGNAFIYDWTIPQLQDAFRCINCAAIAMNSKGNRMWAITNSSQFMLEEFGYSAGNRVQSLTFPKNIDAVGMAVAPAFLPPSSLRHAKPPLPI